MQKNFQTKRLRKSIIKYPFLVSLIAPFFLKLLDPMDNASDSCEEGADAMEEYRFLKGDFGGEGEEALKLI